MLQEHRVAATIPATDLARARAFYTDKLGLKLAEDRPEGLVFESAGGRLTVFPSMGMSSGSFTQAAWEVPDVDSEIAALKSRGIEFEEYDMPDFKTVNGVAEIPGGRGGWFKDSEGNLLAVFQRS